MITSSDYLKLFGNIIDRKAPNNIKFFEILASGMKLYDKYYEKIIMSDVIDFLQEQELDLYASQFNLKRNGMNDEDFRKLIKSFLILRISGTDMNSIINSISSYLDIEKNKVYLFDKNNDLTMETRHIRILIFETVNMEKVIEFLKQIKAAGIIIDCWEMAITTTNYEYNTIEYDSEYFSSGYRTYTINCKNQINYYEENTKIKHEYNKYEYDLNELEDLNDND